MNKAILLSFVLAAAAGCGNDTTPVVGVMCGSGTTLSTDGTTCTSDGATCGSGTVLSGGMCVPTSANPTFVQVEQLARPGVNEALVISNANLEGYNDTAPSFAGAPPAAVTAIVGEAKTVLKAFYLSGCLLNGVLGLTADTGVHPGGAKCADVGGAIFTNGNPLTGTTLTSSTATAAAAEADRVFAQFEPDVMRIDTALAVSGYANEFCGDPTMPQPLLCGGRFLTDDVIDITYNYFVAGEAITASSPAQFRALVSDGVNYNVGTPGGGSLSIPDKTNAQQGHPDVLVNGQGQSVFPYSAPPF